MYAKILVPVDGSEASVRALQEAVALAKDHGATLRLLHILKMPTLNYGFSSDDLSPAEVVAASCRIGREIIEAAEQTARRSGIAVQATLSGPTDRTAASVILAEALDAGAELIVMAVHPRCNLSGIGRDAAEVLSESPVPVLLVRAAAAQASAREPRAVAGASAARAAPVSAPS